MPYPQHVFDSWPRISKRLRGANCWLLFLDFDGTLTPIISDGSKVRLAPSVRDLLRRLAARPEVGLYIISGRTLASLHRLVRVPGVTLLGLHGWEKLGSSAPEDQLRRMRELKGWLERELPKHPGIVLEDKGLGITVHYRGAAQPAVKAAKHAVQGALAFFQPGLRILPGKKCWEFLPRIVRGKGAATRELLAGAQNGTLPVYIGDDVSDESAFAVLRRGLAIHVGGQSGTKAKYWLRDPDEVKTFLERLEEIIAVRSAHRKGKRPELTAPPAANWKAAASASSASH